MASKKIDLSGVTSLVSNVADKIDGMVDKDEFNLRMIDIDLIVRNEKNFYDTSDIESLVEDIKKYGVQHNLVIRAREDGKYELISGERRHKAAKRAGLKKVPCKVVEVDEVDGYIMLMNANKEARKLSDLEWAKTYAELERMMKIKKERGELKGKVRDNTAKELGISPSQGQRLKSIYYNLIPELKEMLDKKELTLVDSFDISKMTEEQQKGIYQLLLNNVNAPKEEVKKVKEIIKQKDEELSKKSKELEEKDNSYNEIKEKLSSKEKELEEKEKSERQLKENIDLVRKQIEEEASKRAGEQNKSDIDSLKTKMNKMEIELNKTIQEKNKLIEANKTSEEERKSHDETSLVMNTEISIILKDIDNTLEKLNEYSVISAISDENKKRIRELKNNILSGLDIFRK